MIKLFVKVMFTEMGAATFDCLKDNPDFFKFLFKLSSVILNATKMIRITGTAGMVHNCRIVC